VSQLWCGNVPAHLWPSPREPRSFQPQDSTRPSSVTASVCLLPATIGLRLYRSPLNDVPSRLSITLGRRTSSFESSPSWPSSVTPQPNTTTSIGGEVQYDGWSASSTPAVLLTLAFSKTVDAAPPSSSPGIGDIKLICRLALELVKSAAHCWLPFGALAAWRRKPQSKSSRLCR
jgi:hypothetical protein